MAKFLMGVFRDRDTPDDGKAGQMTSDPAEIDAVVKRAWKIVYDGMQGSILKAIGDYLEIYSKYILRLPEAKIDLLDGPKVFDSFRQTKESAAALDGWSPKEFSLLSLQTCDNIADMFNPIEAGSPWPRSATHVLIAYLEKEGAEQGFVMSYRPITITAPIYRSWVSMRLRSLEPWVREWALLEMHVGVL